MAPEVVSGSVRGRGWLAADVWSVGCTVVEMASGKPLWDDADNAAAVMMAIASRDGAKTARKRLAGRASGRAVEFVELCLTADPAARPDVEALLRHPFLAEASLPPCLAGQPGYEALEAPAGAVAPPGGAVPDGRGAAELAVLALTSRVPTGDAAGPGALAPASRTLAQRLLAAGRAPPWAAASAAWAGVAPSLPASLAPAVAAASLGCFLPVLPPASFDAVSLPSACRGLEIRPAAGRLASAAASLAVLLLPAPAADAGRSAAAAATTPSSAGRGDAGASPPAAPPAAGPAADRSEAAALAGWYREARRREVCAVARWVAMPQEARDAAESLQGVGSPVRRPGSAAARPSTSDGGRPRSGGAGGRAPAGRSGSRSARDASPHKPWASGLHGRRSRDDALLGAPDRLRRPLSRTEAIQASRALAGHLEAAVSSLYRALWEVREWHPHWLTSTAAVMGPAEADSAPGSPTSAADGPSTSPGFRRTPAATLDPAALRADVGWAAPAASDGASSPSSSSAPGLSVRRADGPAAADPASADDVFGRAAAFAGRMLASASGASVLQQAAAARGVTGAARLSSWVVGCDVGAEAGAGMLDPTVTAAAARSGQSGSGGGSSGGGGEGSDDVAPVGPGDATRPGGGPADGAVPPPPWRPVGGAVLGPTSTPPGAVSAGSAAATPALPMWSLGTSPESLPAAAAAGSTAGARPGSPPGFSLSPGAVGREAATSGGVPAAAVLPLATCRAMAASAKWEEAEALAPALAAAHAADMSRERAAEAATRRFQAASAAGRGAGPAEAALADEASAAAAAAAAAAASVSLLVSCRALIERAVGPLTHSSAPLAAATGEAFASVEVLEEATAAAAMAPTGRGQGRGLPQAGSAALGRSAIGLLWLERGRARLEARRAAAAELDATAGAWEPPGPDGEGAVGEGAAAGADVKVYDVITVLPPARVDGRPAPALPPGPFAASRLAAAVAGDESVRVRLPGAGGRDDAATPPRRDALLRLALAGARAAAAEPHPWLCTESGRVLAPPGLDQAIASLYPMQSRYAVAWVTARHLERLLRAVEERLALCRIALASLRAANAPPLRRAAQKLPLGASASLLSWSEAVLSGVVASTVPGCVAAALAAHALTSAAESGASGLRVGPMLMAGACRGAALCLLRSAVAPRAAAAPPLGTESGSEEDEEDEEAGAEDTDGGKEGEDAAGGDPAGPTVQGGGAPAGHPDGTAAEGGGDGEDGGDYASRDVLEEWAGEAHGGWEEEAAGEDDGAGSPRGGAGLPGAVDEDGDDASGIAAPGAGIAAGGARARRGKSQASDAGEVSGGSWAGTEDGWGEREEGEETGEWGAGEAGGGGAGASATEDWEGATGEAEWVRVLSDYMAQGEGEMSIEEGERLRVVRKDTSGWWEGQSEDGARAGWFPSNYCVRMYELFTIQEGDTPRSEMSHTARSTVYS